MGRPQQGARIPDRSDTLVPSLYAGFEAAARQWPERPALVVGDAALSYESLASAVRRLAASLGSPADPLVGVLAARSVVAYRGVLASLAAGRGYLPLNPKHPADRLVRAVRVTGIRDLVVGQEAFALLPDLLRAAPQGMTVLMPDAETLPAFWADVPPRHRALLATDIGNCAETPAVPEVAPDTLAYVMFTSGSTGEPKGVSVSHRNVATYAATVADLLGLGPEDVVSQMSDLTFDWSVHDLYPCWRAGACLAVVPESSRFAPGNFIRAKDITVWAAVPSSVSIMRTMRLLKPGAFPTIRASVFCGEPLTTDQAALWQAATPNGIIENFYGPTETTVAITRFRWPRDGGGPMTSVVPIGTTFPGQRHRLVSTDGTAVRPGEAGELCFSGSQVAVGYWQNPEETARRFTTLPDAGPERWYRTGDLAREDETGCLHFMGRLDEQVKVRGFRVELQEVDRAVRTASGAELVASVAWPVHHGSADGIVSFVEGGDGGPDDAAVIDGCRAQLPDYMVPRSIRRIGRIPLSANGKIDRRQLIQFLEQE